MLLAQALTLLVHSIPMTCLSSQLQPSGCTRLYKMKRPNPSSLPTTVTKTIENPNTELLVSTFQDRIQILISQRMGKVGTMISCSREFLEIDNSYTYHIENLIGNSNETLNSVYARQIMERRTRSSWRRHQLHSSAFGYYLGWNE